MKLIRNLKKRHAALLGVLVLFFVSFSLSGCQSAAQDHSDKQSNISQTKVEEKPNKTVDADLEKSRLLWSEGKIQNYDMVCSLADGPVTGSIKPVLIKVRDGKAISMEQVDKIQHPSIENYRKFDTVEKIFDEIQKAQDNSANLFIKVGYNKKLGYPEFFSTADNNTSDRIKKR